MQRTGFIGLLIGLAFMVACTSKPQVPEPVEGSNLELSAIDSLMWQQPDSALVMLLEYLSCRDAMIASSIDAMDTMRRIQCVSTTFNTHYAQLLTSELLFKNDYAQTNRTELLQAVAYFDSLCGRDGVHTVSTTVAFLDARAHYINGAGYYEQGDLVNACTEYLNTLRIMESHFAENELVGKKARFMALTYNRLVEIFSAQFMQEPAIYCGKQALVYNEIAPTSPYGSSKILYRIGKQYDKLNVTDSASYYYDLALEYLPDRNDMVYRDIITSRALFEYKNDSIIALDSVRSMAAQAIDETERLARYLFLGIIYHYSGQDDTAKVYLEPVFEKDPSRATLAARILHNIAVKEGDTIKSNAYAQFLLEDAFVNAENQARVSKLSDLFQTYLQEKQETTLLRERRKAVRLTLMVLVPLLVAIGLAVAIEMRRRHRIRLAAQEAEAQQRLEEERQSHRMEQAALSGRLKRSNETLRELQDQVRQQNDTAPKPETSAASFAEEPICLLIMERVNDGQFKSQMDCTVYKDYALGKEQVTALREAADRHFNQFTSRLAKAYPDLTRGDLDYCCLYLLGLSDADVAALMQKAYPTISQRARKMKGIFGSEEPISVVLRGFANESIS